MAVSGPPPGTQIYVLCRCSQLPQGIPVCAQHREALFGVRRSRKGRVKGCKWVRPVRGPGGSF